MSAKIALDVEKATKLQVECQKLSATVELVRARLAKANADTGVSAMLCQMERLRRDIQTMSLFRDLGGVAAANADEAKVIANRRLASAKEILASGSPNAVEAARREKTEAISIQVLPAGVSDKNVSDIKIAKLALAGLSDKLSDLNASKISIEVDADVAGFLGLV